MYSKAQMRANQRYREKAYDQINITVPKGTRDRWKAQAKAEGKSLAAFIVSHIEGTSPDLSAITEIAATAQTEQG